MWNDVIKLIPTTYDTNLAGDPVEVDGEPRQVFTNKKSIRQNEFYQAMATGLKPEIMFEIRSIDYLDETKLEYREKPYRIIRTYDKNGEIIELICSGLVVK